jgi:hypothetical protein
MINISEDKIVRNFKNRRAANNGIYKKVSLSFVIRSKKEFNIA